MKTRQGRGAYKIRKSPSEQFSIAIPPEIGEVLYPQDRRYEIELTDEGILVRPIGVAVERTPPELPAWAQTAVIDGDSENNPAQMHDS